MAVSLGLGRWGVVLLGTALLGIVCLVKPFTTFLFHGYTTGTVVSLQMDSGSKTRKTATIDYVVDQKGFEIEEDVPIYVERGDRYRLLYNSLWPAEGHIHSLKSVFQVRLILLVILLFPWMAFSTSFVGADEVLRFRAGKLRLEKKKKSPKDIWNQDSADPATNPKQVSE